ncbi:hypothetical protein ACFYU8_18180 [Brevibacillus sp. NPDC003359]|uniref:hypothetical protein n=1 Tax=unclassified Brevibacillus TaxID=2684853 RepID=UPI003694F336
MEEKFNHTFIEPCCPHCGHSIYPAKNGLYACNNPFGPCIYSSEEYSAICEGTYKVD